MTQSATMDIQVVENVQKVNDEVAEMNRSDLRRNQVVCINLMGSPGCGKTALLEQTLQTLSGKMAVGVLTGDLTTTRDAERLARHTHHVAQINTGRGCHLEAHQVRQGIGHFELKDLDLLIIENVGNLICPVSWDLGQDVRVGMFSVSEGDDKPAKHPYIVLASDVVVLNKTDLFPYVPFDTGRFKQDLTNIRDDVELIEMSTTSGAGLDRWIAWIHSLRNTV